MLAISESRDVAGQPDFMRRTARLARARLDRTFDENGRHREAIALAQAA
jgi:hypothetical protein